MVRNVGSTTCEVEGYLGLRLVDAKGHAIPTSLRRGSSMIWPTDPGPGVVVLPPGSSASAGLGWEDNPVDGDPPSGCPASRYLDVTLPHETTTVRVPAQVGACNHGSLVVTALVAGSSGPPH